MKKSHKIIEEITIVGRVNQMDVDGELVIITEDEDFYITPNKEGRKLKNFIDEMVEVTGSITHNEDNQPTITISYFASLGGDWDDEEMDEGFDYDDDRW